MEDNRRFSWTDLFIKVILVIIFILFTVWLLSLSNKGMSNSLNVLTDEIFVKNMERMKEVGREYFTVERLPEKVGDIEILTLEKMYNKKLILELKDKYGNACSAENSYVSIEKFDTEYQMKVYLECGEEREYIIVIMGCYDYCDTDICEKKDITVSKEIEYEYKKTTGGYWTNYGNWSEWSKVAISGNNYRQVETKVVDEAYTYDKVVTETLYEEFITSCPEGYTKNSDGTKCVKLVSNDVFEKPVCPDRTKEGFKLTNQNGFTCTYSKTTTSTSNPVCPDRTKDGYKLTNQNGFTCTYSKTTTSTAKPNTCANTYGDFKLVSQNGFTCNYSKEVTTSYQVPVTVYGTCYSQKVVKPCGSCAPVVQSVPYTCTSTGYETKTSTTTETTTTTVSCPTGYTKSGDSCVMSNTESSNSNASCPTGYTKTSDSKCSKTVTNTKYEDINYSCPVDYKKTEDGTKCFKNVNSTVKVDGTKKVTYYRYRVREYIGGTTDYKWSKSKEDKELLNAGYVLTGKTR